MTREEAISNVRSFLGQLTEGCQEAIRVLVPELAESEDERIRKWIVNYIHHGAFNEEEHPKALKAIEWLEKQKEQPTEYLDKNKVYAIMRKLYGLSSSDLIPINSDEYKKINEIAGDVHNLLDYPIEQKPAEWSEEDEKMLRTIISDGSRCVELDSKQIAWLKDLPERFNHQQKQEWSEEDEKMRKLIVADIKSLAHGDESSMWVGYASWLEERLNLLRPKPHWKPSEEEMAELLNALTPGKEFDCDILAELYEQLQKL